MFRIFASIPGGGYFFALMLLLAMAAGSLWRRSQRRTDEMLGFSITGREPSVGGLWKPNPEVMKYMVNRAKILSAIILRGTGEIGIRSGVQLNGTVPRARQVGNIAVRSAGLWDELTTPERELMSSPDGAWTVEQAKQVVVWREQLRLLRWIPGMDFELEPIDHLLHHDAQLHRGLWGPDAASFSDTPVRIPSDARGVHELAQGYYVRALAEMTSRKPMNLPIDAATILGEFRQSALGDSTDFLAGERTVAELKNKELLILAKVAGARAEYADYLTQLLKADIPFPFRSSSELTSGPDSDR